VLDSYEGDRVAIGEIHLFDWPTWAAYYGGGAGELHMVFNFGLLRVEWNAEAIVALVQEVEEVLPEHAWPNWVLGNHDEERVVTRLGPNLARLALMLQLTLRGSPTLYYGDELGLPAAHIAPDQIVDPWGFQSPELSRDPGRSPMPWSRAPNAGFCSSGVTPWLPLVQDAENLSVESQRQDADSFLEFTKRLLAVRRASAALREGQYASLRAIDDCVVFERRAWSDRIVVALNPSEERREVELPELSGAELQLSTSDRSAERLAGKLELAPFEGCIVRPSQ
jgi:alpha-glucosidase